MASFVLALIAVGTLASTWRLVGFARKEAERLAADGYCHDVMRRFVNMTDEALAKHGTRKYAVPIETLPLMIRTDAGGAKEKKCILWRDESNSRQKPVCTVSVQPCRVDRDGKGNYRTTVRSSFESVSNALITVSFAWGESDDWAKTNLVQRLQCVRAGNYDRWKAATSE